MVLVITHVSAIALAVHERSLDAWDQVVGFN